MSGQEVQVVFLLLSWNLLVSARYTEYQGFITPDQSSGSLGALSSPGFGGNGRNAAIVDNGLLNPKQMHSSLSSLSSFDNFMDKVQQLPEQMPLAVPSNDPMPSVAYHSVPLAKKDPTLPIENMLDVDIIQKQTPNNSPSRKTSMVGQIDVTDQKRAFTVDQPTVKKAVNRRKTNPDRHSIPSPQPNKDTSRKQTIQKSKKPKSIRFMSGSEVFRPGQRKAIYKFTGTSFTRSPSQTKRPTQKTKVPKFDTPQESNNQNKMTKQTTLDRIMFGDIFTTESPVTIWRQSVQRGHSGSTKSISVPIASHLQNESPTTPPQKKYSFVNPTKTAVVGSHIITEDNPPSDIIVNHHETSLSERNRVLSRSRYNEVYQTQKSPTQRNQRQPIKSSSSLSNMKLKKSNSNNESQPVANPTHVVSDPYAVADIIVSSNQQGALYQNRDASATKQDIRNHLQNGNRRNVHGSNRMNNFNVENRKEKPMREVLDFQNSGLGLGSLSNPRNVKLNSQNWVNKNRLTTTHQQKKLSAAAHRTHKNKELVQKNTLLGNTEFIASHGQTEIPKKHASISELHSSKQQRPPQANNPSQNRIGRMHSTSQNTNTNGNPSHQHGKYPTNNQKLFSKTQSQQQRRMERPVKDKKQSLNAQTNHHSHWQSKSHPTQSHSINQQKHQTQIRNRAREPVVQQQKKKTPRVPNNSVGSSLSNPGVHVSNTQRKVIQSQTATKNQHKHLKEPVRNQDQLQTHFRKPEVNNVPYTIVDVPPSPAEYFHKSVSHIPRSENVKSVHKIQSGNTLYRDQNSHNPGALRAEYNLRNDIVETRHYNLLDALPPSNSLNSAANYNRLPDQSVFQMENANSLYPKPDQHQRQNNQVAARKGQQKNHQHTQNNMINPGAAKINPLDASAIDASFNIPKELMGNPNIQMLNIENPVQSGYSLDGINILDIKPIKGLSPDIVQISKVTNKIPIIEIPINYNYYDTTTIPAVQRHTNLHTASSLASHGYASETAFTKAPEMLQRTTKRSKLMQITFRKTVLIDTSCI